MPRNMNFTVNLPVLEIAGKITMFQCKSDRMNFFETIRNNFPFKKTDGVKRFLLQQDNDKK